MTAALGRRLRLRCIVYRRTQRNSTQRCSRLAGCWPFWGIKSDCVRQRQPSPKRWATRWALGRAQPLGGSLAPGVPEIPRRVLFVGRERSRRRGTRPECASPATDRLVDCGNTHLPRRHGGRRCGGRCRGLNVLRGHTHSRRPVRGGEPTVEGVNACDEVRIVRKRARRAVVHASLLIPQPRLTIRLWPVHSRFELVGEHPTSNRQLGSGSIARAARSARRMFGSTLHNVNHHHFPSGDFPVSRTSS